MSERSNLISKLQSNFKTRAAYIQAKVGTLVPSQIRALRIKSATPRQPELAFAAEMHQSRISTLETAGANPTLSTLSAIAAALRVGLKVEFVPFSEMLDWENRFSQDDFEVIPLDRDARFLNPTAVTGIVALRLTAPLSNVMTVTGINLTYEDSLQASEPLAPIDLVVAAAASGISVYGDDQYAN